MVGGVEEEGTTEKYELGMKEGAELLEGCNETEGAADGFAESDTDGGMDGIDVDVGRME